MDKNAVTGDSEPLAGGPWHSAWTCGLWTFPSLLTETASVLWHQCQGAVGLFGPIPLLPLDYVEIYKRKKASLSVVIQFGKYRFMLAATHWSILVSSDLSSNFSKTRSWRVFIFFVSKLYFRCLQKKKKSSSVGSLGSMVIGHFASSRWAEGPCPSWWEQAGKPLQVIQTWNNMLSWNTLALCFRTTELRGGSVL